MIITVGISDMKFSQNKDDEIVTHALGSCVGIAIYDQQQGVGGLFHYMLPDTTDEKNSPLMCASTGIPLFLNEFESLGGRANRSKIKAAGGSTINTEKDVLQIGKRNVLALKKILWKFNLLLEGEDFGGTTYRTMKLVMANGKVICKNHQQGEWEI